MNLTRRPFVSVLSGAGVGGLLAIPLLLLAYFSAGGGHGNYLWAKLLFPYTMIVPVMTDQPVSLLLVLLALLQYPLYGGVIGAFAATRRKALVAGAFVLGLHAGAAVACFVTPSRCFS